VKHGILPAELRERIAIAVATLNDCDCCLADHTRFARGIGLADSELYAATQADSHDPQAAAVLGFARDLIVTRGHVEDVVLDGLRAAGFDEAAIVEIVVVVATNIFANLALSAPDICPIVPGKTGQSTRDDLAKDSSRSRP
jgi:AhpD family alkylhydroperoxidase